MIEINEITMSQYQHNNALITLIYGDNRFFMFVGMVSVVMAQPPAIVASTKYWKVEHFA